MESSSKSQCDWTQIEEEAKYKADGALGNSAEVLEHRMLRERCLQRSLVLSTSGVRIPISGV